MYKELRSILTLAKLLVKKKIKILGQNFQNPTLTRMMNAGLGNSKRSVSETKKKYVDSRQGMKCATCGVQLPASFEVDHKIRLEHGGSNEVNNLHAQCRNCHGEKTTMENL